MKPLAWIVPSLLSAGALGGVYVQQRRVASLEAQVATLKAAPPPEAENDEPRADPEIALLRSRIERLERNLSTRPAATGDAPANAAPPPGDLQQLRADVDALLTGEATSTEQGQARLRSIIADARRQQGMERDQQRQQRALAQLSETAHLSEKQQQQLGDAMNAERSQRQSLMESVRSGQTSFGQARPALEALRADTDRKAKEILDADQYAAYESTRAQGQGRGGRGGDGAGGGANGPGGSGNGARRAAGQ